MLSLQLEQASANVNSAKSHSRMYYIWGDNQVNIECKAFIVKHLIMTPVPNSKSTWTKFKKISYSKVSYSAVAYYLYTVHCNKSPNQETNGHYVSVFVKGSYVSWVLSFS